MSHVLLVEDNSSIRELVALLLAEEDLAIIEARNGQEALHLLERHTPQLVITDWLLPDVEGPELVSQMRRSVQADVPILVLSAANEARYATQVGATEFIPKPFDPLALVARVHHWLGEK